MQMCASSMPKCSDLENGSNQNFFIIIIIEKKIAAVYAIGMDVHCAVHIYKRGVS